MSQPSQPPASEPGGAAPQFLGTRIRGLRKRIQWFFASEATTAPEDQG